MLKTTKRHRLEYFMPKRLRVWTSKTSGSAARRSGSSSALSNDQTWSPCCAACPSTFFAVAGIRLEGIAYIRAIQFLVLFRRFVPSLIGGSKLYFCFQPLGYLSVGDRISLTSFQMFRRRQACKCISCSVNLGSSKTLGQHLYPTHHLPFLYHPRILFSSYRSRLLMSDLPAAVL